MAAAHGFKPAFGHTEPKRGAEWWGKSALLTFALFESEPPLGGTLGGRYRRNGYVHNPTVLTARPPSLASQLHSWILGCQVDRYCLSGRYRRQASSHRFSVATHRPHHNRTNQLNRSMVAL
ncbi:hypothetical protein EUX58_23250 [Pseudomonas sp. 770NI]|nr:hypothetical protein EUX58_23250 [Pseudomonas sp. 770NI]